MRIKADELGSVSSVKRQIQARSDSDLQHTPAGEGYYTLPIRCELTVAHRQVQEMRQDVSIVQSHSLSSLTLRPHFLPPAWARRYIHYLGRHTIYSAAFPRPTSGQPCSRKVLRRSCLR